MESLDSPEGSGNSSQGPGLSTHRRVPGNQRRPRPPGLREPVLRAGGNGLRNVVVGDDHDRTIEGDQDESFLEVTSAETTPDTVPYEILGDGKVLDHREKEGVDTNVSCHG
jgi:hypothetical protein